MKSNPSSLQLEKVHMQQQRPSATKTIIKLENKAYLVNHVGVGMVKVGLPIA